MNPFLYALSLDLYGENSIHSIVGQESSGGQFNGICLDQSDKPHNPMVNAGALLLASIFRPEISRHLRHREFITELKRMAGDSDSIVFDYAAFMSERTNCHRNAALTYYLREQKCIKSKFEDNFFVAFEPLFTFIMIIIYWFKIL